MHESITNTIRHAGPAELARALAASRQDTLATFAAYEQALATQQLRVPLAPTLNLPLWELGHVGWFQEWWIGRYPERWRGAAANPAAPRREPVRAGADELYNSSRVAHASRWSLALPDAPATRGDLARQLGHTLALLAEVEAGNDDALYFFRLVLLHEDMHHEAAIYMAQALGIPITEPRWQPRPDTGPRTELAFAPSRFALGHSGGGFAFDNELRAQDVYVGAFHIDRRAVNWGEFLPFVEDGAYGNERWWSPAGRQWRAAYRPAAPRYLRRTGSGWEQRCGGLWQAVEHAAPACHLTHFEAQAWCAWAGRRLPSEDEWERAAIEQPAEFGWGCVWEWTASPFAPYPGFVAHPYREYSAPWFDGRPVLRGASFATQPRMKHPRYRNYFTPERNDIAAGFRSCRI